MTRLLAAVLLLAGCAPAPKPTPEPEYTSAQLDEVFRVMDEEQKAHIKIVDDIVAEAIRRRNKLVAENEALKVLVAELEGRQIHPPEWVDVRDLASGAISVRMSGEKGITIHYDGGSWCNVWADDKGIHWEECK